MERLLESAALKDSSLDYVADDQSSCRSFARGFVVAIVVAIGYAELDPNSPLRAQDCNQVEVRTAELETMLEDHQVSFALRVASQRLKGALRVA